MDEPQKPGPVFWALTFAAVWRFWSCVGSWSEDVSASQAAYEVGHAKVQEKRTEAAERTREAYRQMEAICTPPAHRHPVMKKRMWVYGDCMDEERKKRGM